MSFIYHKVALKAFNVAFKVSVSIKNNKGVCLVLAVKYVNVQKIN